MESWIDRVPLEIMAIPRPLMYLPLSWGDRVDRPARAVHLADLALVRLEEWVILERRPIPGRHSESVVGRMLLEAMAHQKPDLQDLSGRLVLRVVAAWLVAPVEAGGGRRLPSNWRGCSGTCCCCWGSRGRYCGERYERWRWR